MAELGHLVYDVLDPCVVALEDSTGLGEAMPDDGLVHKALAEGLALEAVLEGGAESDTRLAVDADSDGEALVVEVLHDVQHAHALCSDKVLGGDLDVVHIDVGGAAGFATTDVDAGHAYALDLEGDDHEGEASGAGAAGANGHGGVVGEDTVGDP